MSRVTCVNGEFVAEADARVSIFDRGFLFADGIYEVSAVVEGRLVDNDYHLQRLSRSAAALAIHLPWSATELTDMQEHLLLKNDLAEGLVYLQVTRGVADREFGFSPQLEPTLVMFTQEKALINSPLAARGARVTLVPDDRWGRCNVKTIQLLSASLAYQAATERNYDDAWFVRDGMVLEASSANAFIVDPTGTLVTRKVDHEILPGITRTSVLQLAESHGLTVEERSFLRRRSDQRVRSFHVQRHKIRDRCCQH